MLAGIFVYGGVDALRHPQAKAAVAGDVATAVAEPLGLPDDAVTLVRINGGVQVIGGALLAFGKLPRLASLALAASLVPTTSAGHAFWAEPDDAARADQTVQFLKNVAMLGGLVLAAVDTGGRPSLSWRARRVVRRANHLPSPAATLAVATIGAAETTRRARNLAARAARTAHTVAQDASLDSARQAATHLIHEARSALPVAAAG